MYYDELNLNEYEIFDIEEEILTLHILSYLFGSIETYNKN